MNDYQGQQTEMEAVPAEKVRAMKKFAAVLVMLILCTGVWAYWEQRHGIQGIFASGKTLLAAQQHETAGDYVMQVSRLMLLPKDDQPLLATINDPEALAKQQAFFAGSIRGDVVLIFPKAERAVLFSPTRDLIINAGPVITGGQRQLMGVLSSVHPAVE